MKIFGSDSYLIIFFIFGGSILIYVLLTVLVKARLKRSSPVNFNVYHLRKSILTKDETEFYEILKKIINDDLIIFSMVRLADIFSVDKGRGNRAALNRIDSRHVDFLICQKDTLKPVVAIELDDKSHERPDRIKRDNFVNQLFDSAGLSLVRFPSKHRYTPNDVSSKLNPIIIKFSDN